MSEEPGHKPGFLLRVAASYFRIADNTPGTSQWPLYNRVNFMPSTKELDEHYRSLSDEELLKLRAEGGFTAEAESVFDKELARRNLTSDDAKRHFAPDWLSKADVGAVGVLTLRSGERISAEVFGLNEEGDRLSVQVIPSEGFTRKGFRTRRSHRYIPLHRIASFEPQPDMMAHWPFSDPCRDVSLSNPRFIVLTTIFLCLFPASLPLYLTLRSRPYALQEASIITYTLLVVFFTFARTGGGASGRDLPPFKFTCPAVERQIPHLLWRHLGFLVALFVLQTSMLAIRPHLPYWWNMPDRKGSTPFEGTFLLLCLGLAWTQVLTNRSLLNRAHREYSESGTE
jgi:hypothetical protein